MFLHSFKRWDGNFVGSSSNKETVVWCINYVKPYINIWRSRKVL